MSEILTLSDVFNLEVKHVSFHSSFSTSGHGHQSRSFNVDTWTYMFIPTLLCWVSLFLLYLLTIIFKWHVCFYWKKDPNYLILFLNFIEKSLFNLIIPLRFFNLVMYYDKSQSFINSFLADHQTSYAQTFKYNDVAERK